MKIEHLITGLYCCICKNKMLRTCLYWIIQLCSAFPFAGGSVSAHSDWCACFPPRLNLKLLIGTLLLPLLERISLQSAKVTAKSLLLVDVFAPALMFITESGSMKCIKTKIMFCRNSKAGINKVNIHYEMSIICREKYIWDVWPSLVSLNFAGGIFSSQNRKPSVR